MADELVIWCNAEFPGEVMAGLVAATKNHRLLIDSERAANISAGGPSPLLAQANVAFGQPDATQIMELPDLRWVHLTSAGYTRYDRPELKAALQGRGAQLTNSSSVFDEPCAQHLLAFMLAQARQLPQAMADQLGARSWTYEQLRPATRLLKGQTVLILGFGAISRRLVELLQPFNLSLIGVRRQVQGDESIPVHRIEFLHALLPLADHVIDVLPASSSTDRLINAACFELMRPDAVFYNIGRGTTVDQPALVAALNDRRIAAAYLDVTAPEPLPSGSPLWTARNCFITPHIGGGHDQEFPNLLAHFLANLERFESGQPLKDRVF
jgi:phosphoglycerate dehydrogenase-like enzyme